MLLHFIPTLGFRSESKSTKMQHDCRILANDHFCHFPRGKASVYYWYKLTLLYNICDDISLTRNQEQLMELNTENWGISCSNEMVCCAENQVIWVSYLYYMYSFHGWQTTWLVFVVWAIMLPESIYPLHLVLYEILIYLCIEQAIESYVFKIRDFTRSRIAERMLNLA